MSDRCGVLDRSAAELILSVAETPDATITASALSGYHGRLAPVLQESGLLRPRHHQRVAVSNADHDDEPVNLVWSPEHRGYGYFSASAGWVTVSGEQLAVYGVDFGELFRRLLHGLDLRPKRAPDMLVPDLLWEANSVRLPTRKKRVPLWLGRRFADPAVWKRFTDTVLARPAPGLRIVLSLTPGDRLPAEVHCGHAVIAVGDIVDRNGLAIDPEILAARVAAGPDRGSDPISVAADGAVVSVRGQRYPFTGSKQRAVIRHLYEALQARSGDCLTAEVLEAAGYSGSVNTLAKAFSGRTDWRDFIAEQHGRCWMFA